MNSFLIEGSDFVLDSQPIRIVSGAIHYFRVVPEYWRDRLVKLRACGFNTLETYVAWNLHEPRPGRYEFEGRLDLVRYIELAHELGLMVIVRPGPYICSEWDLGGLPSWLLSDPNMRLRCDCPAYLAAVDRWFDQLLPRLVTLQVSHGGPIIAMQVENEYGSYGNDRAYLRHLADGMRARGVDALLFTSDGPTDSMLQGGTLPDVFKVVNLGGDAARGLAKLCEHQPEGPLMVGEFWPGWFDHWGEEHHLRDPQETAAVLDDILKRGASVNVYMFHGGTNFGFMNGANTAADGSYQPDVTSYDYDTMLDEAGKPTAKYFAVRDVVAKYVPLPDIPLPEPARSKAFGEVQMAESVSLFSALERISQPVKHTTPEPMEYLGQDYGFVLYRTTIMGPREPAPLVIHDVRDRALVFMDGEYRGVVERDQPGPDITLEFGSGVHRLDILVENMGRINFGPFLCDRKGITEGVRLGGQFLFHWDIFPLPLKDLAPLQFSSRVPQSHPAFYRGILTVDQPADTYLALEGWTKGVCWVNRFNLGRYWDRGPQRTLYVPGPLLHPGENELIVFELHGCGSPAVEFVDRAQLG